MMMHGLSKFKFFKDWYNLPFLYLVHCVIFK